MPPDYLPVDPSTNVNREIRKTKGLGILILQPLANWTTKKRCMLPIESRYLDLAFARSVRKPTANRAKEEVCPHHSNGTCNDQTWGDTGA